MKDSAMSVGNPTLPLSIFLPVGANFLTSPVDWLERAAFSTKEESLFGGERGREGFSEPVWLMTPENYRRLACFSTVNETTGRPSAYAHVVGAYVCDRCVQSTDPSNPIYTHPFQKGTDLCRRCVEEQLAKQEARQVKAVYHAPLSARPTPPFTSTRESGAKR